MSEEKKYFVYKTTNLINGKIYVGKHTANNKHYLGSGIIFTCAMKKYGKKNFKREILCYCETKEELSKMEFHYIKLYNSTDLKIGYNIFYGSDNSEKMSQRRIKFTKTAKGEELRKAHSERMKEFFSKKENREEASKRVHEYFLDPENHKKQSNHLKQHYKKEGVLETYRENRKKYTNSEKGKENFKIATKRLQDCWNDPKKKAEIVAAKVEFWNNASEEKKKAHGAKIQKGRKSRAYKTSREVLQISKDGFLLHVHESVRVAAESINVTGGAILSACTTSKTHHSKGYLWYFNKEN